MSIWTIWPFHIVIRGEVRRLISPPPDSHQQTSGGPAGDLKNHTGLPANVLQFTVIIVCARDQGITLYCRGSSIVRCRGSSRSGSKVGLYIVQRGIEFHRDSPLDADHLRDMDGLHKFFVLLRFCQMLAFAELRFNVTFEETQAERRDPRSSFAGRGRGWARC